MLKIFTTPNLIILAFSLMISSCVNLKTVNDISSNSLKGIQNYDNLNYTFTKHCLDNCDIQRLSDTTIQRAEVIQCDCNDFKKADKATSNIYQSLSGYFENLQTLSNNELSNYKFDDLKKALTEGSFGSITINKTQVEAYSNIAKILSRAFTDGYRKRHIKQYIEQSNESIQILVKAFQVILNENLKGLLVNKKNDIYREYQIILGDEKMSKFEKAKVVEVYYQKIQEVNSKQKQLENYADGLSKISELHQQLFDNKDRMTAKEIQSLLLTTSNDIKSIISEFKKIK
ncbi:MAG: hypothetical protein MUF58_20395 [Arcicella sp.]|jgi:hypothetical protein|nr:hypothetical protein [Arcicella sp.]